jgi:hypothetical protein
VFEPVISTSARDGRAGSRERRMKIKKMFLLGAIAFGVGMGFATSAMAQRNDECYIDCVVMTGNAPYCACMCNLACEP